ncbi:hypothetical protein JR316_0012075 [Psilocybe cubensis]|uniref:Uncharacterized protein n=1 Tax=Psilocybe cubensis TaxID=181762 RepID=A0ACB8GHI1_PSICU|nr:hypothetical protein JR316_0012075 [Psilocybe cubensis]KAH9474976.1 hypothetical protein JR316_0012075 [Psilocybe cubensis]
MENRAIIPSVLTLLTHDESVSKQKTLIPIVAIPPILFQLCIAPIFFSSVSSNYISIATQKACNVLAATLATGVVIDIALTIGLSALLWKEYMRGTFMLKSRMLQRQILFSVNTGMWTALAALVVFIIFMKTGPDDFMVYGYFHIMSPIYFVTVLANINARPYLRSQVSYSIPSAIGTIPGPIKFAENEEINHESQCCSGGYRNPLDTSRSFVSQSERSNTILAAESVSNTDTELVKCAP